MNQNERTQAQKRKRKQNEGLGKVNKRVTGEFFDGFFDCRTGNREMLDEFLNAKRHFLYRKST